MMSKIYDLYFQTYAELFGAPTMSVEDEDLMLDDDEVDVGAGGRRKSLTHEVKSIAFFGPRQVSIFIRICFFVL